MSQIIYSQTAVEHLQHIAEQWRKDPQIGKHAIQLILQHINRLDVVRPMRGQKENQDFQVLNIKIGSNGFVVNYRQYEQQIIILAIKSYQDAGMLD